MLMTESAQVRRRGIYKVLSVSLAVVLFLGLNKLAPSMPEIGLDSSWQQALQEATHRGMAYGPGIVFTLGPLSGLYTNQYHPDLFFVNTILSILFVAYFVFLVSKLTNSTVRNELLCLALAATLAFLCCIEDVFWYSFTAIGMMVVLVDWREDRPLFDAGFAAILAGIALTKISLGVSTFVLWFAAFVICAHQRRVRVFVWAYPVFLLLYWVLWQQSLFALPQFLWRTFALASGYGEAMGTPVHDVKLILYFWVSLLLQVALLSYVLNKRQTPIVRSLVTTAAYLILGWALFKAGFVRAHDKHVFTAVIGVSVLGLGLWIGSWRDALNLRGGTILVVGLLGMGFSLNATTELYCEQGLGVFLKNEARTELQSIRCGIGQAYKADYRQKYDAARANIRQWMPIPRLRGTVDVYNVRDCAIFAYDLKWKPRPVFQSYCAYTESLINSNLAHLTGLDAPDNILFELVPIDDRYPTLDDGLSLLEIYSRYEVTTLTDRVAVMAKRPNPNRYRFVTLQRGIVNFGDIIPVPGSKAGLVWLSLRFEKTLAGRLMTAAYKAPIVKLHLILSDGSEQRFRVVPSMTSTGFLLSPMVTTPEQFTHLHYSDTTSLPEQAIVVGMNLEIEADCAWIYQHAIRFNVDQIEFERWDSISTSGAQSKVVSRVNS